MRRAVYLTIVMALAGFVPGLYGQDQKSEIQKRMTSDFTLTEVTADGADIVTAGSVLVLHKDGLILCSTQAKSPITNTYKNGTISFGVEAKMAWDLTIGAANQQVAEIPQRKFVAGEKFWITSVGVGNDTVALEFYSDPYDNVRYYGLLKFPFPKGGLPSADNVMKTIAEVVTVDTTEQDTPPSDPAAQAEPKDDSAQPAPPIVPKTIALGQTKDQVVALFGQPPKIASLGSKEIYYYSDMKVTFVDGKVSDVQ